MLRSIWEVLKLAVTGFLEDKLLTHSAALAFCAILSIAPMLIISIAIAGWLFGTEASTGGIFRAVSGLVGEKGAQSIEGMVLSANDHPSTGLFATIAGIALLLVGASGVFGQLQTSLNLIWHVQPRPGRSIVAIVYQRLLSLSMVLVIAFLLLTSLIISAVLAAIGNYLSSIVTINAAQWQALNFCVSFVVITVLFAAIFKVLPDVRLMWSDVWRGALITSLLFAVGKYGIGIYLGKYSVISSYGAAGSLIIVLLWVYYSSVILLFGAELTRAYVTHLGHVVTPKGYAEFQPKLEVAMKAPVAEV